MHVWSLPKTRHSFQDIQSLPIDTPAGEKVKLSDVADVRFASSPNAILRDEGLVDARQGFGWYVAGEPVLLGVEACLQQAQREAIQLIGVHPQRVVWMRDRCFALVSALQKQL